MIRNIGQCASLLLLIGVLSCNRQEPDEIPNRSLDRPTDLALTCVSLNCEGAQSKEQCRVENHSLSDCWNSASGAAKCEVGSLQTWPSEALHLFGFVANSERNEIAMFSECSGRLVDMIPDVPGYNFIPVGSLPLSLTSDAGCRVVSANSGSCDLSVLDAVNLAGYGFGVRSPSSNNSLRADGASTELNPSALVANIRPSRFDIQSGQWLPLGISPALVVAAPLSLSQGSSGEKTLECRLDRQGSAYVTFPACDLVAEVDLVSGRIVQSKQFLRNATGGIDVLDTGASPICPQVDCPNQFQGLPLPQQSESPPGLAPGALELIVPKNCANQSVACTSPGDPEDPDQDSTSENLSLCCDDGDRAVTESTLLVGGMNSDELFEIQFEDNGSWKPEVNRLELVGAHGISRIRVSPGMQIDDGGGNSVVPGHGDGAGNYQFVYAIAGDGSTRVVSRLLGDPNRTEIGIECDTQIDSVHADFSRICEPALDGSSFDAPLERRALAVGPGIRAPRNARILDWSFVKRIHLEGSRSSLLQVPGVVGVGTTSVGRVVYATFGQYLDRQNQGIGVESTLATDNFDRAGTLRVQLPAHSLHSFPALAPVRDDRYGLPLVQDVDPDVNTPGRTGPTARLSPSLRLVDAAYLEQSDKQPSGFFQLLAGAGARLTNADALAGESEAALYEKNVPKVFTRDYRSWEESNWTLDWEGVVPGTRSSNGRFWCNQPAEHEGSAGCQPQAEGDSRLIDEGTNFCSSGVMRGDKLSILGCRNDDDCGVGQKCLLETANGGVGTGICVSERAFEQDAARLRQACRHFIQDPCGEPYREYLITRAYEHELYLQELDQPKISHIPDEDSCPAGGKNNHLEAGECVCDEGFDWCPPGVGHELDCCSVVGAEWEDGWPVQHVEELVDRFICREENPDGGCVIDADCESLLDDPPGFPSDGTIAGEKLMSSFCIEGKCRRPCITVEEAAQANAANDGILDAPIIAPDRCSVRQLPGKECFQELVSYEIRARNSFLVRGSLPGAGFFRDQVLTADDGECVRASPDADISNLKTSRIPLGPDSKNIGLEICPTDFEEANAYTPNPCVVPTFRSGTTNTEGVSLEPPSKYHYFAYRGKPVAAIRYSNPVFSFMLDLVNLESLISPLPGGSRGEYWPASFSEFHRSRIPRGYQLQFGLAGSGYEALDLTVQPPSATFGQLTMPLRIVNSPARDTVFVVDGSGPGTGAAIRGQVLKIPLSSGTDGSNLTADQSFDGVR